MSDFDKEAERERLREKYEKDKAEREATQRMSDLLLKGARMTNTHCNTCGDPLFQMNGTTFCPTCHGGPGAVEGTDLEGEAAGDDDGTAANAGQVQQDVEPGTGGQEQDDASARAAGSDAGVDATPDDRTANASTDSRNADARTGNTAREPTADASARAGRSTGNGGTNADATASDRQVETPGSDERAPPSGPSAPGPESPSPTRDGDLPPADGDLESARDSLRRALERFAREAAETNDPRYARECLAASREAADALAALRGGN